MQCQMVLFYYIIIITTNTALWQLTSYKSSLVLDLLGNNATLYCYFMFCGCMLCIHYMCRMCVYFQGFFLIYSEESLCAFIKTSAVQSAHKKDYFNGRKSVYRSRFVTPFIRMGIDIFRPLSKDHHIRDRLKSFLFMNKYEVRWIHSIIIIKCVRKDFCIFAQ